MYINQRKYSFSHPRAWTVRSLYSVSYTPSQSLTESLTQPDAASRPISLYNTTCIYMLFIYIISKLSRPNKIVYRVSKKTIKISQVVWYNQPMFLV